MYAFYLQQLSHLDPRRCNIFLALVERKRITVQLRNRVGVRGRQHWIRYFAAPLSTASGQIFKDDVNGFSFTSDICFMRLFLEQNIKRKSEHDET
jgi:hypothetical protein